jgi:hypothetical protein
MIRVTVQLDSARGEHHDGELGRALIANTGERRDGKGDYKFYIQSKQTAMSGTHRGFPRKSRTAWELLRRILNDLHERGQLR